MRPPILIEAVTFVDERAEAGSLVASHPVVSMSAPRKHIPATGLFSRTASRHDLAIRLVVRRLDSRVTRVRLKGLARRPGPLGNVRDVDVFFRNGARVTVIAGVQHQLANFGVGRHGVTWKWLAESEDGPFEPKGPSTLAFYITAALPFQPWGRGLTTSARLPWIEALNLACVWAAGAKTVQAAKAAITTATRTAARATHLRYDPDSIAYLDKVQGDREFGFRCEEFIQFVSGKPGQNTASCADVATIVCTFANLVGTRLSVDSMAISDGKTLTAAGRTEPVTAIGRTAPKTILLRTHEVAWMKPGTTDRPVWDATFGFPKKPAINVPFSQYRRMLMGDDDDVEKRCSSTPDPPPRRRRVLDPTPMKATPPVLISEIATALNDWKLEWTRVAEGVPRRYRSLWSHKTLRLKLMIEATRFSSERSARVAIKSMSSSEPGMLLPVSKFDASPIRGDRPQELWDQAFANVSPDDMMGTNDLLTVFYFRKGRWVARVRSVGPVPASVRKEAAKTAAILMNDSRALRSLTSALRLSSVARRDEAHRIG